MTYYQVEFLTESNQSLQHNRFRAEEKAKKHAKRVLGISDETGLASKAIIIPVNGSAAAL
jgi:hypothetical protein